MRLIENDKDASNLLQRIKTSKETVETILSQLI
jgi:hypothetical protein